MKAQLILLSLFVFPALVIAQNIENKLGSSGLFVVEASDGTPIVAINDDGQMSTVGRTNRVLTATNIVLGSVYLEVLDLSETQENLDLEFTTAPSVGTEHLLVIKDMKGANVNLNLLVNVLSHQWISSDVSFDPGDGTTLATITNINSGTNNQIVYSANVTPPGTIIKVVYLGNGLWTASSNFLSTYTPPAKK